jgi:hypothetical protein
LINRLVFVALFTIGGLQTFASPWFTFWDNTKPEEGLFGISFGGGLFVGDGNGEMFSDPQDVPHGEFATLFGFDYWKRQSSGLDFHVSLTTNFQQYHFHYDINNRTYDGLYRYLYLQAPFTAEFPIPNYPYLSVRGGIVLSSENIMGARMNDIIGFDYITNVSARFWVYPEALLGISFLEEKTESFHVKGFVQYIFDPFRNLSQQTSLDFVSGTLTHSGRVSTGRIMLALSVYPMWKRKVSVGKDKSINCPKF